jgi:hypothetical protein
MSSPDLIAPPITQLEDGSERRVGIELELVDIELDDTAALVAQVFGGTVERLTDYELKVHSPEFGTFGVEADLEVLRRIGTEREEGVEGPLIELRQWVLTTLGEMVAPYEIIGPPMAISQIPRFDELIDTLRAHGAQGTKAGPLSAFGLQLNPDVPGKEPESIRRHIGAFALLYDWLAAEIEVDVSRKVTPFVDPYPRDYVRLLLDPAYDPRTSQLIDDYVAANPTRNRALDMLPLFAHLDETRVRLAVPDPRIKSRPTFHYRLPDSRLGSPDWTVAQEWNRWVRVEQLADDEQLYRGLADEYLDLQETPLGALGAGARRWRERCDEIIAGHLG